jgi:hypothetical protein
MNDITLKFSPDEVATILAALSNLPTGSGVWPLAIRIKADAEAQIPKDSQEPASANSEE